MKACVHPGLILAGLALALWPCAGTCADSAIRCAKDAAQRAPALLAFYRHPDETGFAGRWSIDPAVAKIGTIRALQGGGRYDVLQIWGYVYKGRYRMRFIFGVVAHQCVLMGEEILEDAAP
jgi:hypothetical protein